VAHPSDSLRHATLRIKVLGKNKKKKAGKRKKERKAKRKTLAENSKIKC